MHQPFRNTRAIAAFAGAAIVMTCAVVSAQYQGPSSSKTPYILPVLPVVKTASLLTVGDSIGGYRMVGIPTASARSTTATARSRCS